MIDIKTSKRLRQTGGSLVVLIAVVIVITILI